MISIFRSGVELAHGVIRARDEQAEIGFRIDGSPETAGDFSHGG